MIVALGIDYGEARIGVAIAQTPLAEPVGIIENNSGAVEAVGQMAKRYQAEVVVVGISENVMAQKSREFGQKLQDLGLKIEFQDETLTSHEAQEKLRHKRLKFRQQPQDAYQAAVMLQGWLDSRGVN